MQNFTNFKVSLENVILVCVCLVDEKHSEESLEKLWSWPDWSSWKPNFQFQSFSATLVATTTTQHSVQ